jgi:hypothetical protein
MYFYRLIVRPRVCATVPIGRGRGLGEGVRGMTGGEGGHPQG